MAEAEKACEEGSEEYESDLDDGPLSAATRRGAASDDDEEDEEGGGGGCRRGSPPPSTVIGSESDNSGGQGAAELYDDEEVYGTEEEEEDVECEDVRQESETGVRGGETGVVVGEVSLAADEGKYEDDEAAAEGDEEEEAAMKREEVKKASDSEPSPCRRPATSTSTTIAFRDRKTATTVTKGYNDERNMYTERGSRTNQARRTTSRISSAQNNIKSYSKSQGAQVSYNAGAEKHSSQTSFQHEQSIRCNQIFGSNTSSAPPPFYSATRSSHRELPFMQREKARCVTFNKLFSSAVHKAHLQHEQTPCNQTFGSSPLPFYSSISSHQRHCNQPRNAVYKQRSIQRPILPTPRAYGKIFVQKVTNTNTIQSHPLTTVVSSSGDGEATALPEPNSSVVVSAVTGHDDTSEAERTCFLDGGSLVLGNTGARGSMLDDPGSSNTTAKLPVMLFSGLHPRGPGFPSDALVLPEFVDQQRGGYSETRLLACESRSPILTGATGVQEGAISPPYFGSNCLQNSELASSLASPSGYDVKKDPISLTSQDPISLTYQKILAEAGHEFVHLQNRTRRYSEMSFAL